MRWKLFGMVAGFVAASMAAAQAEGLTADIYGKVSVVSPDKSPTGDNSGVIVFIRKVNDNKGFKPPAAAAVMASQDMDFVPEVLPVLAGTTVSFPNRDDTVHNAFSLSKADPFDLDSYGKGPGKKVVFKNPGIVNVNCNIHPAMAGYIMVLGNPFFTVTDDQGNFIIRDVPAGVYTVVSWFPYGFIQESAVDLTKASNGKFGSESVKGVKVDFELTKEREGTGHKNKYGKSY
jgi:plastocyanin